MLLTGFCIYLKSKSKDKRTFVPYHYNDFWTCPPCYNILTRLREAPQTTREKSLVGLTIHQKKERV